MKLLITFKKGSKLIYNFTNEKYAQDFLKEQNHKIANYVVL